MSAVLTALCLLCSNAWHVDPLNHEKQPIHIGLPAGSPGSQRAIWAEAETQPLGFHSGSGCFCMSSLLLLSYIPLTVSAQ